MLRLGILGTGWVVRKHVEAARMIPGWEVVAIASREIGRARAAAAQFSIPRAHGSYEALLDDRVDVVVNALHNGLHCEWTVCALQSGKHVLCEKPLAGSVAEVERMFATAHKAGKVLMEGFMYRFHPQWPVILERVNEIGRVLHIHSCRMAKGREPGNPRYRRDTGGGALLDIGCYSVHFSRAIAGEPTRLNANAHFVEGVDLTLTGMMEFPDNVTAQFCCSMESEPSFGAEIIGTDGKILIPHPWMPPVWPTGFTFVRAGQSENVVIQPADVPQHVLAGFALQYAHFAECIRDGCPPLISESDSLGNARAIEMLLDSARRLPTMRGKEEVKIL